MASISPTEIRQQLVHRRTRLSAVPGLAGRTDVRALLSEVDAALERLDDGSFGQCEHCDEGVETERLIADPLTRVCLGCLSSDQARALEHDLELAAVVQGALLPSERLRSGGWDIAYRYRPLGTVGGDHCDLLPARAPEAPVHFILGDVSGKGVAAALLMAHLQAIFRTLVTLDLPLEDLMGRANRLFCKSTTSSSYATLLLGRLHPSGTIEICNAGHCPPLLVRHGELSSLSANGMPLGIFSGSRFEVSRFQLSNSDLLFLYTDGLSEATNVDGEQYGAQRVEDLVRRVNGGLPRESLQRFLDDLDTFQSGTDPEDDLTVMMIRRQ